MSSTPPRELIEDACQTAWTIMLRSQPDRTAIFAWLRVVAKHETFALLARTRREIPGEELPLVASVGDFADVVDARDALRLIAQLKPQQRQVLLLRAEGHSYEAICELTGRTYTWVNRHISEGRQALRLLIDDQWGSESPVPEPSLRIGPSATGQFERAGLLKE